MKKATIIIAVLFLQLGLNAQIFDKLGKKMEKKIEDRVNRKIDKSMDKTLDKTEEEIDKSVSGDKKSEDAENEEYQSKSESTDPSSFLGGFGKKVDVEDFYDFDIDLKFNMTSTSEKSTSEMIYLLGIKENKKEHVYMEVLDMIQDGKSKKMEKTIAMIFDANNKAMITIIPEDKMIMPMSMDLEGMMEDEASVNDDYTMKKTGKTKDIMGYSCEEYEMESDKMKGNAWVSNDDRLENFDPFSALGNMTQKASKSKGTNGLDFNGPVLEMDMIFKEVEKTGDPNSAKFIVTEIKKVNRKIVMSDYSNPMDFKR